MSVLHTSFARKFGAFVALCNQQLVLLDQLHSRKKAFVPGRDMIHEGQVDRCACILASGWVCCDKLLPGGTRQVVDFQILGDFLDAFNLVPRLATAVLRVASRDEAMVAEHLVDIGRPGTTLTMKVCC